jgi:MFS family permease
MDDGDYAREEVGGALGTAALAGLIAAIVGGVVWGLIVRWSGYEVGFVAWGIGFVVGTAVAFGARGVRGLSYQALAVVLALAGIVLGKYLSFAWTLGDAFEEEGIPIEVPIFSGDTWDAFVESRSDVWGWFDLLWIGLAVFTAFRIPGELDVRQVVREAPDETTRNEPRSP